MSFLMFLKIFGDVCLCFSVLGAFPALFPHEFTVLWPALLCGLGAGIAALFADQGRGRLKYLGVLFGAASLLFPRTPIEFLMLLPGILYTGAVIIRGSMHLEYYSFRDMFRKSMMFWGIFFGVIFLLSSFESISKASQVVLNHEEPLFYGILYALCGIFLLRQLRMGADSTRRDSAMSVVQMAVVLVGTGAGALGILAAEQVMHESILDLMGSALSFLIGLPLVIVQKIYSFVVSIFEQDFNEYLDYRETLDATTHETYEALPMETVSQTVADAVKDRYPWWLAVLILVIMIAVLVVLLRSFHRNWARTQVREQISRVTPPEKEKKQPRRSNRSKVRRYYREFIRNERRRGLRFRTNQTSQDILEAISPQTDSDAAAQLREVYLKARYDAGYEVTSEDVRLAKELLRKSQKQ